MEGTANEIQFTSISVFEDLSGKVFRIHKFILRISYDRMHAKHLPQYITTQVSLSSGPAPTIAPPTIPSYPNATLLLPYFDDALLPHIGRFKQPKVRITNPLLLTPFPSTTINPCPLTPAHPDRKPSPRIRIRRNLCVCTE